MFHLALLNQFFNLLRFHTFSLTTSALVEILDTFSPYVLLLVSFHPIYDSTLDNFSSLGIYEHLVVRLSLPNLLIQLMISLMKTFPYIV